MSEKVFFHTAHKALWNWLSKNPGKRKYDWPGWEENGGMVDFAFSYCFACEYANGCCEKCPLVWTDGPCVKKIPDNLFCQWFKSNVDDETIILAAQIRDLPVREGVVCK